MARLSISMKSDIINVLEEEAVSKGKTVSSILSEAATLYAEVEKVGIKLEDLLKTLKLIEIMHDMNAVPVPSILLDSIIRQSLKNSESTVLKSWFDRGVVLGNILRMYVNDLGEFTDFIRNYRYLIPIDMLDISISGKMVKIVMSGVGNSHQAAICTSEGLKGFLSAFDYKVDRVETSDGFVKVTAEESPPDGSNIHLTSTNDEQHESNK